MEAKLFYVVIHSSKCFLKKRIMRRHLNSLHGNLEKKKKKIKEIKES